MNELRVNLEKGIKVTPEMIACVRNNIEIVATEKNGRYTVFTRADWEGICRRIIGLHQNLVRKDLTDRAHI